MSINEATVVLVHGAWADETSWDKVVHLLSSKNVKSATVRLPLSTLADDTAALDNALDQINGPVVLVAHAYAGAVIASTRSPKVKALVYIAALAPDQGEAVAEIFNRFEHSKEAPQLAPDEKGWIWLPEDAFKTAFAQDATPDEQKALAKSQLPLSPACITVPVGEPLWKSVPTWFLVAERDHMIPVQTQKFMAQRMDARTVSYPVDHVPNVTAPKLVEEVIVDALKNRKA